LLPYRHVRAIHSFPTRTLFRSVKCILDKAVSAQCIVHAAGKYLDGPTVVFEPVVEHLYPVATFHVDGGGVLGKDIVLYVAIPDRSEEHTSNSSHVKISYAVFCL